MGLYDSFGNVKTKVNFLCMVGTALAWAGFLTSSAIGILVQNYGFDEVVGKLLNSKMELIKFVQSTAVFFALAVSVVFAAQKHKS